MAASGGLAVETPAQEVFEWLKKLPLAPEYHPSLEEFQDPIAYIFKIEKEASKYGICKIVPPVLAAPKKTAIANLNRSLAARAGSCGSKSQPTFTTRQQQIGFCPRKHRPVQRPVWQSGEYYTFQEFEAKAKAFERSYLKKCSKKVNFSPLEMETLYWKATVDKPFSVEYANDMPGSAFSLNKNRGKQVGPLAEGVTVGETEWNMRGVSRAKGSLLRFMKEEIPGVTSPMLYIAMMFSWFAWHVEDHDLHSLNYLHMGAGKTWYGVPREAAVAFEEVVRVHGYGEEINPLVTFSVLGEKTTVVSPEVFINAGVPCCRLVQNAGEFVVTFPRAYHSGFSHGFNCGEAANIATPEWLRVAKDAAIRRASINYPPMVSHFQLLYDLALEICTRVPVNIQAKPRSSRLKDKQKGEGETLVKELFVKNVTQNNDLLDILGKGSSIVLFPQSSSDIPVCSNLRVGSQLRLNPSLGICSHKGLMKSSKSSISDDIVPVVGHGINQVENFFSMKGKFASLCERSRFSSLDEDGDIQAMDEESERGGTIHGDKLSNQRLFSCVRCGIWSFDCVAIVQPREAAARYLMSADCSFFNDWITGCGVPGDGLALTGANANTSKQESPTRWVGKNVVDGLYDVPVQSVNYQIQMVNQNIEEPSDSGTQNNASALGLLALNYGNSSDSEEDQVEPDSSRGDKISITNHSESTYWGQSCALPSFKKEFFNDTSDVISTSVLGVDFGDEAALQTIDCHAAQGTATLKDCSDKIFYPENPAYGESNILQGTSRDLKAMSHITTNCLPVFSDTEKEKFSMAIVPIERADTSFVQRSDEDCQRMHVFCLEHAAEVEQQLRPIGGVNILLLCHPEYPRIEAEARLVSEELGVDYLWKDISFRDATKDDEEMIQTALDNEDAIPGNGDWAVKLGINLFYSAILSRSPLYSKQMPYNSVIYRAFGRNSPASSPSKLKVYTRRPGKQKKVVAGKWCGKVWMSSQVHPFLAKWDSELHDQEQEQERRFHNLGVLPDEKLESKQQSFNRSATPLFTKSGRRRKLELENISAKKAKYLETEDAASDDSGELHLKIHSWKETKDIEKGVSYDSLEDDSYWHHGRICRTKRAKAVKRDDAVSDDSLENISYQQDHRIHRSKQAKYRESKFAPVENNLQKQRAKDSSRKQTKWVEVECAFSDDSLEDNGDRWYARAPRSAQAKSSETEDAVSDGSLEESSHWQVGRIFRGKQTKHIEKEVSDDSSEHSSHWQTRRTFGGNCSKYTEREDVVSDNSLEESTYQQHTRFPKSRLAKYIAKEEADSDDSLGNNTYRQRRRILKSKQATFIEMEHSVSDDSVEENIQQPPRRISRSKIAKFIAREDAASDGLMVDDTHQEPRRIPRRKKAKFSGREDVVLHDLCEGNTHRQLQKTPRGKQTKFIEGENEAWDDLLGENSNQHSRRVLRNKQNKIRQMKLKTPQHVKQETPRRMKKEMTQSFNKEKQMKQEIPRLRNNRNEQNSRHIDSGVEVELEGGPSTRLRQRPPKFAKETKTKLKGKSHAAVKAPAGRKNVKRKEEEAEYQCDIEGCTMSFGSKQELAVHKRNICPVKGCGKKFFSHKYLVQHRRVHLDDRPLKCPWKGCKMTFKWAWARTEHIRVHTGARPYVCAEEGCGQTFRFVSDFSRHKRKTGHSTKKGRG